MKITAKCNYQFMGNYKREKYRDVTPELVQSYKIMDGIIYL